MQISVLDKKIKKMQLSIELQKKEEEQIKKLKALINQLKLNKTSKYQILYWDKQKKAKKYEGEMKNGKRNGKGIEYYDNGKKFYDGEWKDDMKDGKGTTYDFYNGKKNYEGKWKDDKKDGKGIFFVFSGEKFYEGEWKDNKKNGKGIYYDYNGKKEYEGEWEDDKKNGKGIKYWKNGKKEYEGEWEDNEINGKGIKYWKNGNKKYDGEWKDGKWNGKGISYNEDGKMLFKGYFKNGNQDCPPNKIPVNNKCVTKKKCGKEFILDQNKNECNKKRILLKKNVLGNVKWLKPDYSPGTSGLIVPLSQVNVKSFGSEVIDQTWITKQYEYYTKLNDIDKLFLLVYTDFGDGLINKYLLDGIKGMSITAILNKNFDYTINPFFTLFVKHPEIYKNNSSEFQESKDLCKRILDKTLSIKERYKVFQKLFKKYFTKEFLEKTLEQYMNVFNANLNRIIDASPKLKKEMLVARGSRTELIYNDKWTKRFTSTSISSEAAEKFTGMGNYIDIYILTPGTPCIPLFLTRHKTEYEILLGAGCCNYKIEKKQVMKEVQELAKKQFSYSSNNYNMRYFEVSKKI